MEGCEIEAAHSNFHPTGQMLWLSPRPGYIVRRGRSDSDHVRACPTPQHFLANNEYFRPPSRPHGAGLDSRSCQFSRTRSRRPGIERPRRVRRCKGREQERRAVRGANTSSFHMDVPGVYAVSVLTETGRTVARVVVQ